jgi:hypothetical protein
MGRLREVIMQYAEYAPPGAMGNEGGVMLYVIKDDKEYIIYSSVESVFIRVAYAIRMNLLEEA